MEIKVWRTSKLRIFLKKSFFTLQTYIFRLEHGLIFWYDMSPQQIEASFDTYFIALNINVKDKWFKDVPKSTMNGVFLNTDNSIFYSFEIFIAINIKY